MAIAFSKEISESDLLSSFNSNIVEFNSDNIKTAVKCTIDFGSVSFEITPNISEVFSYDLKNATKDLLNENNFIDSIIPDVQTAYRYTDTSLYKIVSVIYTITFDDDTTEDTTKNYRFIKSVRQPGRYAETVSNPKTDKIVALLPFKDYSVRSYIATYHVGFPFDIAIYSYDQGYMRILNKTNSLFVDIWVIIGVNRIFFSDGNNNFTIEDDLPLLTGINELEITNPSGGKITVFLTKKESGCGPYLKYYSKYGGYGYFLFNDIFTQERSDKIIDTLQSDFTSIEEQSTLDIITGKISQDTINMFTEYLTEDEFRYLDPIFDSPRVELYLYDQYQQMQFDSFRGVRLSEATYKIQETKKQLKRVSLTVNYINNTMSL